MTKIDIISGFLGAGKTTFIKKLLEEAIAGEQVVLIENEFGEIGIDGGFLKDSGIEIREMNSGCICCSLVGDFGTSLAEVLTQYKPERIIIEPSGVGKLSDVMKAVIDVSADMDVELNSAVTIVDAAKCKMYMKNFGEFFNNQIENAGTIVLSRTDITDASKIQKDVDMIREKNANAVIIPLLWTSLGEASFWRLLRRRIPCWMICWQRCGRAAIMTVMARSAAGTTTAMMRNAMSITTITMRNAMSITMTMMRSAMSIITTAMTRNAMSIITTIMMRNAMLITTITMRSAMSITTAMMRSAMSIITTITMRNAMGIITMMAAVMSITIIMQTRCLPAGEWKPLFR